MSEARKPIAGSVAALAKVFRRGGKPIIWVGAGLSVAAGYPLESEVVAHMSEQADDPIPADAPLPEAADLFVESMGGGAFAQALNDLYGRACKPTAVHQALARLCKAGLVDLIITTNCDGLIEDALGHAQVPVLVQTIEQNAHVAPDKVRLLKVHGSHTDWAGVVASESSVDGFARRFQFVMKQLHVEMTQRPLLLLGVTMTEQRILDWLRDEVDDRFADLLKPWRPLMTATAWQKANTGTHGEAQRVELLRKGNIRPIALDDQDPAGHQTSLWNGLATELAPLDVAELVFDVTPGPETWTIVGPTPESAAHTTVNPLTQAALRRDLATLRRRGNRPVGIDDRDVDTASAPYMRLGRRIGHVLTEALLSGDARAQVNRRMNQVDRGRARLTIRTPDSALADAVLALPWELITPRGDRFSVRERELDIVREVRRDGAPPVRTRSGSMVLAAVVSAPADQAELDHATETARLRQALAPLDHEFHLAGGGHLDDLLTVVERTRPAGLHFSGHGCPGELVFTGPDEKSATIRVDDIIRQIRERVLMAGTAREFPALFFLASCHGMTDTEAQAPHGDADGDSDGPDVSADQLAQLMGRGPSTAAALHRTGFAHVIGYFGPVGDTLCTRAEVAFYESLARGESLLQAGNRARASTMKPVVSSTTGKRYIYPLGWAQLAVYHRGPDVPLVPPRRG